MYLTNFEMKVSYVLIDNSWVKKDWSGYIPYSGNSIWKYSGTTYCTENGHTYILGEVESTYFYLRQDSKWNNKGQMEL
jgi:hypothetical protein